MKMKRSELLSTDWQPSNEDRDYGHRLHLTDQQIDDIAEEMRLWAVANEHRVIARKAGKKGWSAAFKGWMRRESKKFGLSGNGKYQRDVQLSCHEIADEMRKSINETTPISTAGEESNSPSVKGLFD